MSESPRDSTLESDPREQNPPPRERKRSMATYSLGFASWRSLRPSLGYKWAGRQKLVYPCFRLLVLLHRLLCGRMKDIASNVKGKTARQQPLRVIFAKLCKKMKHPFLETGKANIDLCSRRLRKNMPLKLFFSRG